MIAQVKKLWLPLLILAVLVVTAFILFTFSDKSTWVANGSISLGSGFLSSFITIVLLDVYISAKDERQRVETEKACLRSLNIPLSRIVDVVFNMKKASTLKREESGSRDTVKFLRQIDIKHLARLDTAKEAPVVPHRNWEQYLIEAFSGFSNEIEKFVDKYAFHLDVSTIELCEKLINHNFIYQLRNVEVVKKLMSQEGVSNYNFPLMKVVTMAVSKESMLNNYLNTLASLAVLVDNALAPNVLTHSEHWEDNVAPKLGSAITVQQDAAVAPCSASLHTGN